MVNRRYGSVGLQNEGFVREKKKRKKEKSKNNSPSIRRLAKGSLVAFTVWEARGG